MDSEMELQMVAKIKSLVTESFSLKDISDDDLEEKIEELVSLQWSILFY